MKFLPIPKDHVDSMWEHIEPIITRSVSLTHERIDTQTLHEDVKKVWYLMWVGKEERKDVKYIQAVLTT